MPVCEMDVRVGGKYKWQWRSREDGKQFGFFGTYTEVNGPSKLVQKEYFDPGDVGGPDDIGDAMPVGRSLHRAHLSSVSRTASRRSSAI